MPKIDFSVDTPHGRYKDALHFTDEQYASLTEEQIEQMKQERVSRWLELLSQPPLDPQQEWIATFAQRLYDVTHQTLGDSATLTMDAATAIAGLYARHYETKDPIEAADAEFAAFFARATSE